MITTRRGFIFGLTAFSIVRPEIIMPIKQIITIEPMILPPGKYEVVVDDVIVNDYMLKMMLHGVQYGMGEMKLAELTHVQRIRS